MGCAYLEKQYTKLNACSTCVYKKSKETIEICPKCNNESLHFRGDGSGCNCTVCGYGWATSPIFPQCSLDDTEYTIEVNLATKSQYVKLAKLMSCNVVEVKKNLDNGITIIKRDRIWKVAKLAIQLENIGIDFKINPNLFDIYNDIRTCEHEILYGD